MNEQARQVVAHQSNEGLVSKAKGRPPVLNVGQHKLDPADIIATIGRGSNADIFVAGLNISKIQCSFEIIRETDVIMLCDRSRRQSTYVSGPGAMPFEHGRLRQVAIGKKLNTVLGIGGKAPGTILFEIIWHNEPQGTTQKIKNRFSSDEGYEPCPRLARTGSDLETAMPSYIPTTITTPGLHQLKLRYLKMDDLGQGKFGTVRKCLDVDTGRFLAVKVLRQPGQNLKEPGQRDSLHYSLRREVEALSHINHVGIVHSPLLKISLTKLQPHIIEYISSQGWDGPSVEIFMGLKDGDLASLVLNDSSLLAPPSKMANVVFFHMLQALDYLSANEIVHRDVKPANILYSRGSDGEYNFQLGDFGLCNHALIATSLVGSPLFMAPELLLQNHTQTSRVDIWSLYVTMIWILDIKGFRTNSEHFKSHQDVLQAVLATTMTSNVICINEMARVTPVERASAAQMLVRLYAGVGLTTPRDSVPPIMPMTTAPFIPALAISSPPKPIPGPTDARLRNERQTSRFRIRKCSETRRPPPTKRIALLQHCLNTPPAKCHDWANSPLFALRQPLQPFS